MHRRHFLKSLGLTGLATVAFPSLAPAQNTSQTVKPGQSPRKIIMLVADGMSLGTLTSADEYSRLTRKKPLVWSSLIASANAELSLMDMASLNSIVTDSAAAASAWASGRRVNNGSLNALPDGKLLRPLMAVLKAGKRAW